MALTTRNSLDGRTTTLVRQQTKNSATHKGTTKPQSNLFNINLISTTTFEQNVKIGKVRIINLSSINKFQSLTITIR